MAEKMERKAEAETITKDLKLLDIDVMDGRVVHLVPPRIDP